ncbi:MAG: cytochrome c biogenesis protein CcdA [Bacteriovoracaceae bacterium]
MSSFVIQSATLFGAGVLTSLTPCVYPMIPITLGYLGTEGEAKRKKVRVIGFILGQILCFTALGVIAVSLGEILGFSSEIPEIQVGTGFILLLMAYFSHKGSLPSFMNRWNQNVSKSDQKLKKTMTLAFFQAILIGMVSALVASPCTSPVLGGVLASIAGAGSLLEGATLMFFYSSGMSVLFLILGLGLVGAKKLPNSGKWLGIVHKLSTILLILGGIYFISYGLGLI